MQMILSGVGSILCSVQFGKKKSASEYALLFSKLKHVTPTLQFRLPLGAKGKQMQRGKRRIGSLGRKKINFSRDKSSRSVRIEIS